MRRAGQLAAEVLEMVEPQVQPSVTTINPKPSHLSSTTVLKKALLPLW